MKTAFLAGMIVLVSLSMSIGHVRAQCLGPNDYDPSCNNGRGSGQSSLNAINNANDLFHRLASIGSVAVYLLVSLGVVYITYSIVMYFIKGKEGDESRRQAGLQILWGIIGLAIIISLWGLVNILVGTFGTNNVDVQKGLPNADFLSGQ